MSSINYRDGRKLYTTKPNDSDDPDGIRDYFLKIIEVMPNLVFWVNKDSIALGCNKNELDLLGLKSLDQFIGLSYEEIGALTHWTKDQMAEFRQADQEVIATGKPKLNVLETPLYRKDNSMVQFLTSRVPLFDNEGNSIGVVGISIDITDQIKAKEVAKQLAVEKERSQVLETLGASIAHELRTPLASLRLGNDAIMQELPKLMEFAIKNADEYEKMFANKTADVKRLKKMQLLPEIMKNSIDSANFIINTLLMNINESHRVLESAVELSIRDLINKAINQYPLTGNERTLINWEDNSDFICKGKETLFIYVIFNLIKNSLYHIHDTKKGTITICLDATSDEKYNLLIFKDTAKGIAPDKLSFIFEKFYSNRFGGTGLGLAFCKLALETFDGKITCDSKEGEYTTFTLSFPKIK
jgi:signal transduction histidine kinase